VATAARLGSRIDAGLLAGCVALSLVALVLPNANRDPVAGALRRSIVAPLVGLQNGAERWRAAWLAGQQRQLAADSVAMRAIKDQALQVENDQLRKIIGLGSRLQWGFVPAEALHSTAPSEDVVTTLTLAAGTTAGIQPYSPVVAPEGLVGTIYKADPTMSIVLLYTNPDFRASAMTADGQASGIVHPHPGRVGGDPYMLELRGISTRIQLKPGTQIFTSGLGGTFPRGILIGTVVQELKTSEVWTRTYLLRPAVTPSRVTAVVVLNAQRVTQGTGNVWGGVVNTDSASKRIAAAADSMARLQAIADAKARAAVLDSLKATTIDSVKRALGAPATPPATGSTGSTGSTAAPVVKPAVPAVTPMTRRDSTKPDTVRKRRDTTRIDSIRKPPV
jgi:rod shape-determining protein MreC